MKINYFLSGMLVVNVAASSLAVARSAPVEMSSSCLFDVSVLPETSGRIAAIYPGRTGSVGNVILDDGQEVIFPQDTVLADGGLMTGQTLTVYGLRAPQERLVDAIALKSGRQIICPAGRSPGLARFPVKQAHGRMTRYLHASNGRLDAIILSDGTTVRFPAGFDIASVKTMSGDIEVSGRGIVSRYGRVIVADSIAEHGGVMRHLQDDSIVPGGAPPGSPDYDIIESGKSLTETP